MHCIAYIDCASNVGFLESNPVEYFFWRNGMWNLYFYNFNSTTLKLLCLKSKKNSKIFLSAPE